MNAKNALIVLFGSIFVALLCTTAWASWHQPVLQWTGLTLPPNRYWTIATMMDAYFGFITFYVWVFFKETSAGAKFAWFILIMAFGNMAMSAYVLWQIGRLQPGQRPSDILWARNP